MRGGGKEKSERAKKWKYGGKRFLFECMLYTGSLFWGREGEGKGDNFSIQEAAANFSYPVPLGWLPLLPSNRRFERIEFFSFVIILSLEEKGEKRGMR